MRLVTPVLGLPLSGSPSAGGAGRHDLDGSLLRQLAQRPASRAPRVHRGRPGVDRRPGRRCERPAGRGDAGATLPLTRFMTPPPTRWSTGKIEAMPHYAGQSVGAVQKIQPAADIVRELAEGAERLLRGVKD